MKKTFAVVVAVVCASAQAVKVNDLAALRAAIADKEVEITIAADTTIDLSADGQGAIVLPQNTVLKGENRDTSIISGGGKVNCIHASQSGIVIENITVKDGFGGYKNGDSCRGSGVYMTSGSILGCTITGCQTVDPSRVYGGGVCMDGSGVLMSNCVVRGCSSRIVPDGDYTTAASVSLGGGVYVNGSARIVSCEIIGCIAYNRTSNAGTYSNTAGGGIYLSSGAKAVGCLISGNIASNDCFTAAGSSVTPQGSGGGACLSTDGQIVDSIIINNHGARQGGGVSLIGQGATLLGCTVTNNVCYITPSKEWQCRAGGIYVKGEKCLVKNTLVEGNLIYRGTGGKDAYGGGFSFNSCSSVTVACSVVRRNYAGRSSSEGGNGGAFDSNGSAGVMVTRCVITENVAVSGSGGCLISEKAKDFVFDGCIIRGNEAGDRGSLWLSSKGNANSETVCFRNCYIADHTNGSSVARINNRVSTSGVNSMVRFTQCTIVGNKPKELFSLDWNDSYTNILVHGCAIFNNGNAAGTANMNAALVGGTNNVMYCYIPERSNLPADTETFSFHNLCDEDLPDGPGFVDAANGDYRLLRTSDLRGAGGAVQSWMGTGMRKSVLDCGDGTWTEKPLKTIVVNGKSYPVGIDLVINGSHPRIYNGVVDIGCFQYYCPPGLLLLVR